MSDVEYEMQAAAQRLALLHDVRRWDGVYIAGSFARRLELHALREWMHGMGLFVTSRWLDMTKTYEDSTPADLATYGEIDLADIRAARVLIAFLDVPSTRGGTQVELGYALGRGMPIGIIGPCAAQANPFTYHADLHWLTPGAFQAWLTTALSVADKLDTLY